MSSSLRPLGDSYGLVGQTRRDKGCMVFSKSRGASNPIHWQNVLMEKTLRLNKSLGEIETESGVFELLATAEATHDKRTGTIVVMLNSFLQLQRTKRPGAHLFADSSVGRRTVTKEAAEEKYAETVGSIFANWVHCLEQTSDLLRNNDFGSNGERRHHTPAAHLPPEVFQQESDRDRLTSAHQHRRELN